ncbi:hypothetical protein [Paludisphaera mucosa]|uniref:Carboxypeptidase regulatory-like domain-containing protein n=1 Tax=Paludisphaera mucosa TaxID=3030827 RepID=A0ABT6FH36_9BACT|nr:hypothetical protein [Paludisphaera mucosa]MDG3006703.1 hypothetical protein [Paludisphaera mucosa]
MDLRRLRPALLATAVFAGCGEPQDGPPIHPVSGRVLVDGAPAVGAEVVFHSTQTLGTVTPPPTAIVEPDGAFRPSTRTAGDGAPAGEYRLTVVWRGGPGLLADDAGGGEDRLRGRYARAETSGLQATIRPGENVIPPIDLKAAKSRR